MRREPSLSARPSESPGGFLRFRKEDVEQSIPARFEEQARKHAGRVAVRTPRHELTYESLNRFGNRAARAILAERGEGEEPIALLLEQGETLAAAILGALKAGKIYVPIDPSYSCDRIDVMLEDSGAGMIVTDEANGDLSRRFETPRRRVLSIEGLERDRGLCDPNVGLDLSPDRLAYVFYTSGSTGRPKGVVDCHRNVLHNVLRYTNSLRIGPEDRLTLLQGPSFSGSVSSLFGALLNGAAVLPFDPRREGLDRLADWMDAGRITIYHSVPAIFEHLDASGSGFASVRVVRLEGDRASWRHVEIFRRRFGEGCVLVNGLGATETGISRQFFVGRSTLESGPVLPVGRAAEDVECTVVDESGREAAAGEVGEILVKSRYLAVGYWRRPDETRAAFLRDPDDAASRIYRTGDLGRMRPDGCLEHLGRKGLDPKVGGVRVEVEAIERALLDEAGIRAAVVAVREEEGAGARMRIVAYFVPSKRPGPTASALRRSLAGRLPAHLLPSAWVALDRLPLDPNGKVDRRVEALPSPGPDRPDLDSPFVAPRSPDEEAVAAIWREVLAVSRIGVHDDFFDLGGDSLRAMQMVARVRSRRAVEMSMRLLFDHPTVARLVSAISTGLPARRPAPSRQTAHAGKHKGGGTAREPAEESAAAGAKSIPPPPPGSGAA